MAVGNPFAKSQGFDFVSNNKYLQEDFKGSTPLDFSNVSSSGIMSQAPVALKYIQRDGGGRDNNDDDDDDATDKSFDYETEAYGLNNLTPEEKGITQEEQEDLNSINNAKMGKMGLAKTAFSFLSNPFLGVYRAFKENKKAKQDAIDKAKAAQQQRDFDAAKAKQRTSNPGGRLGGPDGMSGGDYAGGGGFASANAYGGDGTTNDQGADTFAKDGGRVGYFFGGRVNYKAGGRVSFKNGGLASIL